MEKAIEAERITILCGAGVSMDAGLPSWPVLLHRIARRRAEAGDDLAPLIPETEKDLIRAAGLLVRKRSRGATEPDYSLISGALYGQEDHLPSTYLAKQIAKVAGSRPKHISIATTNFDDILETALRNERFDVVSCSLDDGLDQWWEGLEHPDEAVFHLLHLHGYFGRDRATPMTPILLTEDQFRRDGQRVQSAVRRIIGESDLVLGIGLSLTDPNLMGPLSEASKTGHVFLTNVAGPVDGLDADKAEQLAVERAAYMEDLFAVQVVPLNAYAQSSQLMAELELAMSHPKAYLSSSPSHCARYGYRLHRSLKRAYSELGWPVNGSKPKGHHLEAASNCLQGLLDDLRPDLKQLVLDDNSEDLRAMGRHLQENDEEIGDHLDHEGLGLFLWLPSQFDPSASRTQRLYQLQLVGTSTYSHREYWSFHREPVDVNAYSTGSQAKAAFSGQPVIEATTVLHEPRLWRTNVAIPLSVVATDRSSNVSLGAVVLASDRLLMPNDGEKYGPRAAVGYLKSKGKIEFCQMIADRTAERLGRSS